MISMRKLFLFTIFSLVVFSGFSQSLERYNWYFGSSTQAIRFNRTSSKPSIVTKGIPFGGAGAGTVSDPANANLLFYTDGARIYDATNLVMPNGSGLTANIAGNQPVAMCPVPGQAKKYFVFTNTGNFITGGTVSVTVVDMNLFGNAAFPTPALGDVETKNVATGLTGRAEGMIIIPHNNGTDFWLVTEQVNSLSFSVTLINAASYTGTFTTTTTTGLSSFPLTAANLAYHAGKSKIAVSPQDTSTDAIILNFNTTTGALAFDRYIFNSGFATATGQSIYDVEWSMSGDYLYVSRFGEPGVQANLFQYDYVNPTTSLTSVLPAPVFRSFGLQMAPDSNIYHLYQSVSGGPVLVGAITKPDTIATEVKYKTSQLSTTSFQAQQFPAFAPKGNITQTVDFTSIGTCMNNNTTFFPNVTPGADSLAWDFGDGGQGSNAWSPVHKYAAANTYSVKLTAYYEGQSQTVTKPVVITQFDLKLQLVQDTTACRSEFPPPRGKSSPVQFSVTVKVTQGTATSYTWSNGDTGAKLTPDSAGYYYVVVTDATGCSAYAGVNVKEYGLQDQRKNIWFFGGNAGIDFNVNPPVALTNSAMDAPEGCAIVCDRNGKTIFYTDGDHVYNKKDALITSAIGGGTGASQSSIIVPVPGDETLYYIFTNEVIDGGTNVTKYSLFDLKLNNGLGGVPIQDQTLFSRSTERITASGKWVVIHEWGNNTFRVYPFSATGIGEPVLTAIGSDHTFASVESGRGYMKLGPKNNLAVALSLPTGNFVEVFHLNDTTGKLTTYRKIDLKDNNPADHVYGIEFSPAGNKLYASVTGADKIYEYFIDSINHIYQVKPPTLFSQPNVGALQLGPDGQIYVAIGNNSPSLGRISPVDDTTRISSYQTNAFNLAGKTSHLGLPNFIQQQSNAFGGPSFSFTGLCLGDTTKFTGVPTDQIDHFSWSFGDGGSGPDSAKISHIYATANTFVATMRLTNRCGLDTLLTKNVTINNPPKKPTIPGAAALCNGPVTLDANTGNVPNLFYKWSTGDSVKTITVSDQSIVAVKITDLNGCTSAGQSIIVDNRPQVELGPNTTVCQNVAATALNAQNPGATYAWSINGTPTLTSQGQPVNTTLPGSFTYKVIVTDPVTTCTATDQTTFTVVATPTFTLTGTNPTACNAADGTLQLNLTTTAPPTGPYSYFLTGPGFNQQAVDQIAPQTVNVPGVKAGTYSAIINDQISGCTLSQSVGLSDTPPGSASAINTTNCDPETVQVTTTLPFPITYQVTNSATGVVSAPVVQPAPSPFNLSSPLTAGSHVIQLKDNLGCITTVPITITPSAPVAVTVTPNICATPPTLTANAAAGTTYAWSGPGVVGPNNNATVTVSGAGSQTYTVIATPAAGCPNTVKQDVVLDNPIPNFTQSDPCQTTVVLSATPVGTYTYRWYKAGVFQPGLQGRQISLNQADDGSSFQTELLSTMNGCTYKSNPPKSVSIVGPVTAGLSATPACDDNKPFTLTSTTSATGVTYAWFKNNTVITGQTTPTISQTDAGTYRVEISKTGCKGTSQITITKAPLPVGKLPNREVICNDPDNKDPKTNNVDLDPGAFTKYDWFKNELSLNYTKRVYNATSQGKYKVNITNAFGCVAPDEVEVRSECIPRIDVPNAFRPTSSITDNKEFYAFTFFITDANFQVFIYNRWGELIFSSPSRDFKWNGGYNNNLNQPLPGGTYAWVIKYVSAFHPERGVQEKRGGVTLLR
jgi:gliding motility-associated-like protein